MIVKVGDKIQLNLQLEGGETNKFPRAYLKDADGVDLAASPVDLVHVGNGLYANDQVAMPDTLEVTATFKVFDDALFATASTDYYLSVDVFQKDPLAVFQIAPEIEVEIDDTGEVQVFVEDEAEELSIDIEDDEDELETAIDDEDLTVEITEDVGEISSQIEEC